MKRNSIQCQECGIFVSLSNFSKHKDSKTCKRFQEKGISKSISIPDNLICRYCFVHCNNDNSFRNHERTCTKNSNRQLTYFATNQHNVLKSKKNFSNQFTKAEHLGLPKPIVSEDTRKKIGASNHNKLVSYSSKECQLFINRLLSDIPELVNYKLYYHGHPHEFVLNFENGNKVCYDFVIKELKIIVEYNGVKFHPKSIDDVNFKPIFESQGSAKEIWIKDQEKIKLAADNGYNVLICWNDNLEEDYIRILKLLKENLSNHTQST